MVRPVKVGKNTRMSFSKIENVLEMPNLIEVQKKSYQWFLDKGLNEVLRDVSPITDYSGNLYLDFLSYSLQFDSQHPQFPVEECKERDISYEVPLKMEVRLVNKLTGEVKQSEIYMGNFPVMTENGSFVINGAERVVVSQIVRSPGIYYDSSVDKTGKKIFTSTVIPYRGAWLEYETDANDVFYVRIDKNRKIPVTNLIRALGVESRQQLEEFFGTEDKITATLERDDCESIAGEEDISIRDAALKEIYKKLRPGEPPIVESAEMLLNNMFFNAKRYDLAPVGRYKFDKKLAISSRIVGLTLKKPAVSPVTGEILFKEGHLISREDALEIEKAGVNEIYATKDGDEKVHKIISNGTIRPETVLGYDLSEIGLTDKVSLKVLMGIVEECGSDKEAVLDACRRKAAELAPKHITPEDILASIGYLLNLSHGIGTVDDIDHLGNRRLRSVGELLQNQMRIGFSRLDKIVREKMTTGDADKLEFKDLINTRPVATAIREFFGSSPLSQFMDQSNPLA
ncbi:MAG: DNA-directed RNA polymerase subunit beta, partial [Clostridia bacterium]|nr:DNA-directed RNA polymerase subunit beta [Clostridia bacterium]